MGALAFVCCWKVNIYTNSHYALTIAHAYSAIWKVQRLLTSNNKDVKHSMEILALLEAIQQTPEVAIIQDVKKEKPT